MAQPHARPDPAVNLVLADPVAKRLRPDPELAGEDLVLLLKADRDVFVEVVHTAANGQKTILVAGGTKMTANRGFKTPAGKVPSKAGQKEQMRTNFVSR